MPLPHDDAAGVPGDVPVDLPVDLGGLAGRYQGWAHRGTLVLATQLTAVAVGVGLFALDGGIGPAMVVVAGGFGAVGTWRSGRGPRTTVITPAGFSTGPADRPAVRTLTWAEVEEVHERPAWRRGATARLRGGEEVALPGVPDDAVRGLRAVLDARPGGQWPGGGPIAPREGPSTLGG